MRSMGVTGSIVAATAGLLALDRAPGSNGQRAPAPPQADTRPVPATLQQTIGHLREEVQRGDSGTLVISNEHYQARFSELGGLAVTPRVDRQPAPQLTWRYRARRVETATARRALEPVAPTVSPTGHHVVDFERPGIIERYQGERTGVEQIFVLTERPSGTGDVRIVGDVAFDGRITHADGGLAFAPGGHRAPFTYSKPIAFDADRKSLPVHVELHDSELALVLDDEALKTATFPVTIDPLYGIVTSDIGVGGPQMPDIAYNPERCEFLVVYAWFPQFGGAQIRARRYLEQGDPIGGMIEIQTTEDNYEPKVAYDYQAHVYLAVWNRISSAQKGIYGQFLGTGGGLLGSPFKISALEVKSSTLALAVRNGRDHVSSDPAFMAVWIDKPVSPTVDALKREFITSNGVQSGEAVIGQAPAGYSSAAYDPVADRFVVAWINHTANDVLLRSLSPSGASSATLTVGTDGSFAKVGVDPTSLRYLVAWRSPATATPVSLKARVFASGPTPTAATGVLTLKTPASGWIRPYAIASGRGEFLLTYGQFNTGLVFNMAVSPTGSIWNDMSIDFYQAYFWLAGVAVGQHGFIAGSHSRFNVNFEEYWLRYWNVGRRVARYVHGSSGDYDGDGRSDLFLYTLGTGEWAIRTQTATLTVPVGVSTAIPVLLDWDGDGLADLCTFNTSNGQWRIRVTATAAIVTKTLGLPGDIPVPGDYRGDFRDEIGVFRPGTNQWLTLGPDEATPVVTTFGTFGDQPTPADWDGDGKIELGVFRSASNLWLASELDGTPLPQVTFTGPGIPFQGNFVGNDRADQALYQHHLAAWKIRDGQTGAITTWSAGTGIWGVMAPLDWDGDGHLDIAWYDSESQMWNVLDPALHREKIPFGQLGDIPAGAR
jgi:hypothetical protein